MNTFKRSSCFRAVSLILVLLVLFWQFSPNLFAIWCKDPDCQGDDECCDTDDVGGGDIGGGWSGSGASASCLGCEAVNHIIKATGNLFLQIKPFKLEGIGFPIAPVFTYNSNIAKVATPYGRGWCLNYDRRIILMDEERTRIVCETGRGGVYTFTPSISGNYYETNNRDYQQRSILYPEGDAYIEEYKSGTKYRFVMDDNYGYIADITDRYGNALVFNRDEDHKIISITDSSGREVVFTYLSGGKLRRITLPDPGDGSPAPVYSFNCGASLTGYESPEGSLSTFFYDADYLMTDRIQAGKEIRYLYEDPANPTVVTERKRIVDGHTYSQTYDYDRENLKTTMVDEEGYVHTTWYDDYGNTIKSEVSEEGSGPDEVYVSGWGADGKQIYKVRMNGQAERYNYDERRNLTYKGDGEPESGGGYDWGLSNQYTYDANDNLTREEDSIGRVTTYGYDQSGNRTRKTQAVTDPDSGLPQEVVWTWTHYANGLIESRTDPNGNITTYEYDNYGNPINIQLRDSQGAIAREEVNQYNALNRLLKKSERIDGSRWRVTEYTYDHEGRVLTVVYNEDPSDYEENIYDCCYLVSYRNRNGNITTYQYRDTGKVWKQVRAVAGTDSVTEYDYNGRDELVSVKNCAEVGGQPQSVRETTYEYDARGRRTKETRKVSGSKQITTDYAYDEQGRMISETGYLGGRLIVTAYEYDGYGRRTKVIKQIDENTTAETRNVYDAAGRRIEVIDPLNRSTYFEYDELDRITRITEPLGRVTEYRYDGNGNQIKVISPLGIETTYAYNGLNQVASITQPVNEGDIATVTTSFEYDCFGNRTLVIDGQGNQTRSEYDLDGRLSRVTNANNETIDYTYYPGGQLETLTDANGHTTFYVYDEVDKLVESRYAYGTANERVESFAYDDVENMTARTLRSGETITYEYDLISRMTKKTIPGSPAAVTEYAYDDLGRMTSVTDGNGTITYAYNDANRLLATSYPGGKSLGYGYDLVGNRTRLTYSDDSYVEYTYDDLNRMDQVKDQEENVLADYSYDALRRTGLEYLNGTSVSYEYNDAGWITALYNNQSDPGDISYFVYTHDRAGNRLTNTSSWGTQTYAYDDIYQVTAVDYPDGYPFPDMTYNYDPVGNRDSTVNGGTVDYQHNELNEYTSVDWTTFTSDLRGNLVNDGNQGYQYDLENRLTAVNGNISYDYNPFGLRISKTVDGETTSYILDNNRVIEEWEDGELQRKFIYGVGIDEPLVMEISASKYFYYYDALGSVHNLTDSAGSKVATYHYDIFGAFQLIGSLHNNLYTFTGRKYDPESGLYYYRARYYSPGLGRFLQVDPAGYEDGPNLFTYVSNLPISYYDPYGLAIFEKGYLCPKSAQFWIDPYDECPSGWARVFEECYWWCWICLGREIKKFDDYDCNYTYECLFFGHPAIPPDGSTWA